VDPEEGEVNRHHRVASIMLIDSVLLVVIAFVHILSTPIVGKWFALDVSTETLSHLAPTALVNQLVGILLIPFGVSTLYCSMGVRTGQHFARTVAMVNAVAIVIIPFVILFLMGPQYLNSVMLLSIDVLLTLIGVSMFLLLLWI
jgi:hypothetical protein